MVSGDNGSGAYVWDGNTLFAWTTGMRIQCRRSGERNVVFSSCPSAIPNGKRRKQGATQLSVQAIQRSHDIPWTPRSCRRAQARIGHPPRNRHEAPHPVAEHHGFERALRLPFSLYAGWLTAATILNTAGVLFLDIDLPPDTLLRRLLALLRG